MTTNAPVGPPICTRDPPKSEMIPPATTAQYRPDWGVMPGRDRKRHRERQRDEADRDTRQGVCRCCVPRVVAQARDDTRSEMWH